jgi:uncharacterized membrane protein
MVRRYSIIIITLLSLVILYRIILPSLISAQSDEAVWFGITLLCLTPVVAFKLFKRFWSKTK